MSRVHFIDGAETRETSPYFGGLIATDQEYDELPTAGLLG
jgi:hypothetical protein